MTAMEKVHGLIAEGIARHAMWRPAFLVLNQSFYESLCVEVGARAGFGLVIDLRQYEGIPIVLCKTDVGAQIVQVPDVEIMNP